MKNKKRAVKAFLTANRQKLDKDEVVFYFMYNRHDIHEPKADIDKYKHGSCLAVILISFSSFLILPEQYSFLVILLSISLHSSIFKSEEEEPIIYKSIEIKPFCLITSRGIRLEKEIVPWDAVYSIRKQNFTPSKQTLVFQLSPLHKEPIVEDLNVRSTQSDQNHIILGGKYNAAELYNLIFPHWDKCSPNSKLKSFHSKLKETYQLTDTKTAENEPYLTGKYKTLKLSTDFGNSFPFKPFNLTVQLPKSITTYLNITHETITTKLKEKVGVKDLKIGHSKMDDSYRFLSSHPTQFQQLFTEDVINRFVQLTKLGSINCSFGKQLKRTRLSPLKSNMQETEDVLDTGLLNIENQQTGQSQLEGEAADTLEFNGILNPNFEDDVNKVTEFMTLSLELSLILAEGLKEID